MMEGTQNPAASVRTEHALAFATYSRRLTQGMVSVALVHPVPPVPQPQALLRRAKNRVRQRASANWWRCWRNRADTRISCRRSQRVPRVRLSLRKAAWSSSKPTNFTGNTVWGTRLSLRTKP
jgi:hypothetical protein